MKTFAKVAALIFLVAFLFMGCAKPATIVDANYQAYLSTLQAQADAMGEQKPIVDLQLDEEGKLKGLKVYREPKFATVEQKRPDPAHPGWKILGGAIKVGGALGGMAIGFNGLEGLVEAGNAGGNITNIGSGNSSGGDFSGGQWDMTNTFNKSNVGRDFTGGVLGDTPIDNSDQSVTENPEESSSSSSSSP